MLIVNILVAIYFWSITKFIDSFVRLFLFLLRVTSYTVAIAMSCISWVRFIFGIVRWGVWLIWRGWIRVGLFALWISRGMLSCVIVTFYSFMLMNCTFATVSNIFASSLTLPPTSPSPAPPPLPTLFIYPTTYSPPPHTHSLSTATTIYTSSIINYTCPPTPRYTWSCLLIYYLSDWSICLPMIVIFIV